MDSDFLYEEPTADDFKMNRFQTEIEELIKIVILK